MSTWVTVLYAIVAAGMVLMGYQFIKRAPKEVFSKESMHKSVYVLGIISLGLIIFIWVLIKLLQA